MDVFSHHHQALESPVQISICENPVKPVHSVSVSSPVLEKERGRKQLLHLLPEEEPVAQQRPPLDTRTRTRTQRESMSREKSPKHAFISELRNRARLRVRVRLRVPDLPGFHVRSSLVSVGPAARLRSVGPAVGKRVRAGERAASSG